MLDCWSPASSREFYDPLEMDVITTLESELTSLASTKVLRPFRHDNDKWLVIRFDITRPGPLSSSGTFHLEVLHEIPDTSIRCPR